MNHSARFNSRRGPSRVRALFGAVALVGACALGSHASAQTTIAHGLSPLQVLLIKDAIRQNWAEYTLLIDGDGVADRKGEWAQRSFTPDLRWIWFDPDGNVQRNFTSMEEMRQKIGPGTGVLQGASKHLPISIKFDDITPTTVKTRSVVVFLGVPKAKVKGEPDGVPGLGISGVPEAGMAVYHDTWRKVGGKWMKSESILYSAQKGFWPSDPTP